jgi:hypothetical protein
MGQTVSKETKNKRAKRKKKMDPTSTTDSQKNQMGRNLGDNDVRNT